MMSYKDARLLVREAFRRNLSREPNLSEAQHLEAVAIIETSCGSGWHRPANWPPTDPFDPENMGAVQKGATWTGRTFKYTDTHPNPDGTSTPYQIEFRYYDSPQRGMDDAAHVVYVILNRLNLVLPYATKGDTLGFSSGLHQTSYYEGFGKDDNERIANHCHAITRAIAVQASALGEPMPNGATPPPVVFPIMPVLRLGAMNEVVRSLQQLLARLGGFQLKADRVFGPKTLAAVKAWQKQNGLKVDGVVGWATWHSLGLA